MPHDISRTPVGARIIVRRRSGGCTTGYLLCLLPGAMQYVPELTWILVLRILDETEEVEATNAKAVGAEFRVSLESPYR